jgi:large subunit ribosomal protein L22
MSAEARQNVSARRQRLLGDAPGAFAVANHVRVTPQKAKRVGDLLRGANATEAIAMLKFQPQAVAANFYKLVDSAVSNAETTEGLNGETLVISQVYVDEGPTMKRWRPRAKGSANRILKRTSHLTVVVTPEGQAPIVTTKAPAKPAKAEAPKAAAKNPPRPKAAGGTPTPAKKAPAKKAPAKKAPAKKAPAKKAPAKKTAKKES